MCCLQVNLQHKRAASNKLVRLMSDNQIGLAFVQEPYNIGNHLARIPKSLRTYVSGDGRKRSAFLKTIKK
jgi:hypothetical protein